VRRPLVTAVVLAIAARLAVLASPLANLNGDEGVTGVMAQRIAHGHLYTFFAGQSYLGALEPYLQAPFTWLAPHNPFVLRLPLAVISGLSVVLVFTVGLRLLGSERRALVAAWIYALGPAYSLLYGDRAMSAYAVAPVLGLLALHVALHRDEPTAGDVAVLGLTAGLGVWATLTSYYLILPALLWTVGSLWPVARRRLWWLVPFGLLGSAPLWIWMLRHRAVGGIGQVPHVAGPAVRSFRLVVDVLPEYVGVAWFGPRAVLPRVLWYVAVAVLIGALCWALIVRWRGLSLLSRRRRRPFDVVVLAAAITLVLYVASPYTWYSSEPRYLYPALPLLAWSLGRIRAQLLTVAAVAALSIATVALYTDDYPTHWNRDLRAASQWMQQNGYTAAYADFRTAYPSDFLAGTTVAVVPYGANASRFPDLTRRADSACRFVYLAANSRLYELASLPGSRLRFGSVTVVLPVSRAGSPAAQLPATCTPRPAGP
jgi:4-amino-4-deoxy-L-arabinose transferase-like glycosyltransferase